MPRPPAPEGRWSLLLHSLPPSHSLNSIHCGGSFPQLQMIKTTFRRRNSYSKGKWPQVLQTLLEAGCKLRSAWFQHHRFKVKKR